MHALERGLRSLYLVSMSAFVIPDSGSQNHTVQQKGYGGRENMARYLNNCIPQNRCSENALQPSLQQETFHSTYNNKVSNILDNILENTYFKFNY